MGLIANVKEYFASRHGKRIERAGKLVKNPKAIRDDRWAALQFLAEDVSKADEAIPQLLARFEYSLEHGINDTREKELALQGIARFSEEAVPFLKTWLQQTQRIAWPIKVLKELGQDSVVVECLKSALNFKDVAFDQGAVDKNYDILCYLREYAIPDSVDQIAHFLKDPDERVRFAAAELLIAQKLDATREHLAPFLKDESAENRRVRQAVIEAYVERGWKVVNVQEFPGGRVADGIYLNAQGQIEVRT
jgi:hypothetical protein